MTRELQRDCGRHRSGRSATKVKQMQHMRREIYYTINRFWYAARRTPMRLQCKGPTSFSLESINFFEWKCDNLLIFVGVAALIGGVAAAFFMIIRFRADDPTR